MAPALVEHTAGKERNSASKTYLDKLSCIAPLDLVLVDKIKRVDSTNILKNKLFAPPVTNRNLYKEKENKYIPEQEIMTQVPVATMTHTVSVIPAKISMNTHATPTSVVDFAMPKLKLKNNIKETGIETTVINGVDLVSSQGNCKTVEERTPQPVATLEPNYILSCVKQKQELLKGKLFDINKSFTNINSSVRRLRLRNTSSHIACNIRKPKDNLITEATQRIVKSEIKDTDSKQQKSSVESATCGIASSSQHQNLCKSNTDLRKLYDVVTCLEDDDTDYEEDFDTRVRVPVSRGKRKSEQ